MNKKQRRLIIARDGFRCVVCGGKCHLRGHGEEPCKLPSTLLGTKNPVAYWRLDDLQEDNPQFRLHGEHVFGKRREGWNEVCAVCPCCHAHKVTGGGEVYEAEVAYLATVGPEPEEYRIAREQEAKDKPRRRAKRKASLKVYRRKRKERLETTGKTRAIGGPAKRAAKDGFGSKKHTKEPTNTKGLRLPSKTLEQLSRPVLNTFRS